MSSPTTNDSISVSLLEMAQYVTNTRTQDQSPDMHPL